MIRAHKILDKINSILCKLFGMEEKAKCTANFVSYTNNRLEIFTNEPHKRHRIISSWPQFCANIDNASAETKAKLGIAIGKALATDFIVSFENPKIERRQDSAS